MSVIPGLLQQGRRQRWEIPKFLGHCTQLLARDGFKQDGGQGSTPEVVFWPPCAQFGTGTYPHANTHTYHSHTRSKDFKINTEAGPKLHTNKMSVESQAASFPTEELGCQSTLRINCENSQSHTRRKMRPDKLLQMPCLKPQIVQSGEVVCLGGFNSWPRIETLLKRRVGAARSSSHSFLSGGLSQALAGQVWFVG